MGYSTKIYVQALIANSLSGSTPTTPNVLQSINNFGTNLDSNLISDDIINQYISWADEDINSYLNELYVTPLNEICNLETTIIANIDSYNDYIVTERAIALNPGDTVVLTDGSKDQKLIINEILNNVNRNVFTTLEPISYFFNASNTRLLRVKYPDPIPLISASIAAARIYDKYFSAQADVNSSKFGADLMEKATRDLNNILNGRTILHGVRRIGNRFYNSNLDGQYGLPMGNIGAKDIDKVTKS